MRRATGLLALAGFAFAGVAGAEAQDQPRVAIVQPGPDALVYYDASADVVDIVHAKLADGAANARLERAGLRALAQVYAQLSDAKTISVQVVYAKTGDVNPAYGTHAFLGVEKYAILEIAQKDAASDKDGWRAAAAASSGTLPRCVSFTVRGKLPPR